MNLSPKQYHCQIKLMNAAAQLKNTSAQIAEVADSLGYYSPYQFCRDFKAHFGVTPTEYRSR